MNSTLILSRSWAALLLAALSSCRHEPESPGDFDLGPKYPAAVYEALNNHRCFQCHGDGAQYGGLDLSTWSKLKVSGSLVPYWPDYSHLLWHVNLYQDLGIRGEPFMPVKMENNQWVGDSAGAMSYETVKMLNDWIAAGAKNNNGEAMWEEKSLSPNKKYLFLSSGADLIGQVDAETGVVTRYASVGVAQDKVESPHFVVSDGEYLYLTLIAGGKVEKYRADDLSFVARTEVGASPAHVKVGQRHLIVTHWNPASSGEKVTLLDKSTMQITDQISGSFIHRPHGLAVNNDFSRAYITANDGNYFVTLNINPVTGKFTGDYLETVISGTVPAASATVSPYQCVLSEDETRLYVTCPKLNAFYLYDVTGSEPSLVRKVESPGSVQCNEGMGLFPKLLALAEDKIFVVCYKEKCASSANRGREGCVSVFDLEGNWIKNVYGLGHQLHGIDYDPNYRRVWVTCENQDGESHHSGPDAPQSPGQINAILLPDLTVERQLPREVASFPTGGVVIR